MTVSATATSGLAVTFTSTTTSVCTGERHDDHALIATGTCTIQANQAGNGTYNAAPLVARVVPRHECRHPAARRHRDQPELGPSDGWHVGHDHRHRPQRRHRGRVRRHTRRVVHRQLRDLDHRGRARPRRRPVDVTVTTPGGTSNTGPADTFTYVKLNQTITFSALANKTLLQSPVTVAATATSGLAVTFTSTTPLVCTTGGTNGTTVTLVAAGTCTIQADQAGNGTYNAAPAGARSRSPSPRPTRPSPSAH